MRVVSEAKLQPEDTGLKAQKRAAILARNIIATLMDTVADTGAARIEERQWQGSTYRSEAAKACGTNTSWIGVDHVAYRNVVLGR